VFRADGYRVGDTIEQIKLLDADAVNLVENVNDGYVAAALRFQNVNQVIDGGIAPDSDIRRTNLVPVFPSASTAAAGK
jgi:hypothetical protein